MGTEYTLKFASDPKLRGQADTRDGCAAIERDLNRLEKWPDRNLLEFNRGECQVLHLGRNNPVHQSRAGDQLAGKELSRRELGVPGERQAEYEAAHAAINVNSILSCIRESIPSKSRKVIIPFHSALVRLHLECCVQFWAQQYKKNIDLE
ncbi:hypothetical protein llap_18436 [Limosa lapponica baueri]|uniref:Rna-directed dna polymerase from mobile element jockey-like n=1 Tax=Limosa lapponica baueri TaxID=1758121 RepID=A0A2I0TBT8_LIMLA|nr:hypothetical protein llap_18436 [Limosa lapponica baueri]